MKTFIEGRSRAVILLLAWASLLAWLSLVPSPPEPPGFLGWDKLQHAVAYGVLTWLIARMLAGRTSWSTTTLCWIAFSCAIVFGAVMEVLQLLMQQGRAAEWQDLVADGLGALSACVVFRRTWVRRST